MCSCLLDKELLLAGYLWFTYEEKGEETFNFSIQDLNEYRVFLCFAGCGLMVANYTEEDLIDWLDHRDEYIGSGSKGSRQAFYKVWDKEYRVNLKNLLCPYADRDSILRNLLTQEEIKIGILRKMQPRMNYPDDLFQFMGFGKLF